ncbi:MAG TPA: cation:proton antiporter [Candidatus Thermoplasmatota archaeon]|nr:cation:proton antiporter [Candidatus Thermoplasmatota archaeon]
MADLLVLVAVLGAALAAAGWLAHRLSLPPPLGYLAAGIAISPLALSEQGIPPDILHAASAVGVLFVLFLIGLELDLKRLREALSRTAMTLPFDLLVPAVLAYILGRVAGWSPVESAALGLAACLSSTIFGERLAAGAGMGEARKRALGVLLAQDVMAGALLAVIAVLGGGAGGLLGPVATILRLLFLFILLTGLALLLIPRLLDAVARRHSNELLVLTGGALVVAFGAAGTWAGSAELGALVAGVAAAEAGSRFVLRNSVQSVRDIGLALFFFTSGLLVDVNTIAGALALGGLLAVVFLVAKLAVHVPASLGHGLGMEAALRTGLSLGTLGEFSLILVAAAQQHGIAHPDLGPTVITAMVILLTVTPILANQSPAIARAAQRSPKAFRRPVARLIRGIRTTPAEALDGPTRRSAGLLLAANVILLLAWGLVAFYGGRWAYERFPTPRGILVPTLAFGVAAAVAAPLVLRAYRAYREFVWLLVGLDPSHDASSGAGRVRARLVDAWVAATVALLLIPVSLIVPSTLPVLIGGLIVAVSIVALAWRQLSGFQRTLESTITRVLGHDPRARAMLDSVLSKYPWGVRFAAGTVAPDSPVAGRTIAESRLHELTGALVAVLESGGRETVNPPSTARLQPGDTVVLMGEPDELAKAEALLVAHGEALRVTVQSRLAEVVEVPVHAGSPLVGRTLGQADLRTVTGALVVGLWPHGARHPSPFRPDLVVQAADQLILLGAPLQVERARRLATGETAEPAP